MTQSMADEPDAGADGRDELGRFTHGNAIWRNNPLFLGQQERIWETPDDMLADAKRYFAWIEANPLQEQQFVGKDGRREIVKKLRAMTLRGFYAFIGISSETWEGRYRARPEFAKAISAIENAIWSQKFEGAAAGLLNASIITRELGLSERTEISGPDKGPIQTEEVSPRERIARKLARLAAAGGEGNDTGGPE